MKQINIVGGGLFGLTLGRILHDNNIPYHIFEKESEVGGMVKTTRDENGVEIHSHGAHIFHTDYDEVIEFVTRFSEFTDYRHRVKALINHLGEEKLVELPLSLKTLADLYGSYDIDNLKCTLGDSTSRMKTGNENLDNLIKNSSWDMFEYILKPYTENQWGMKIEDVPGFILDRIKFKEEFTIGYFKDKFQGIPKIGYDGLLSKISNGLNITTNWKGDMNYFTKDDIVVWTGGIDECIPNLPELPYRSLEFEHALNERWEDYSIPVINTPSEKYTRKINHKLFRSDLKIEGDELISYEYPIEWTEGKTKYYPIGTEENINLYSSLKEKLTSIFPNLILGGRLGEYAYYDMDDTIMSAITLSKRWVK